jgi:hypothetical protein
MVGAASHTSKLQTVRSDLPSATHRQPPLRFERVGLWVKSGELVYEVTLVDGPCGDGVQVGDHLLPGGFGGAGGAPQV